VVNAIAHIDIKSLRLSTQGIVARCAAAGALAEGPCLENTSPFLQSTLQWVSIGLSFQDQVVDDVLCDDFGGAGEEGFRQGNKVLLGSKGYEGVFINKC
jgi:hypothetical protein